MYIVNPGSMDGFELTVPATTLRTSHGAGYPLPGGYDEIKHDLTK